MRKLYPASIDEEDMALARSLGLDNFSEFCRDAVSYFISGTDRELTKSEIRELSKRFAIEKRAALQQQQKITGKTEEEEQQIAELKAARADRIAVAVRHEIDRVGLDRFRRYMEDTYGDYHAIQDDTLAAISESCGIPVSLADVLAAMKAVRT